MKKTLKNHFLTLAGIFLLCITTGCSTKETETSEVTPELTTAEETREVTLEPTTEEETNEATPEPATEEETNEATLETATAEETSEAASEPTAKQETQQDKLSELPQNIQDIFYGSGEFYDVVRKQTYTKNSYEIDVMDEEDNSKQKVYWDSYMVVDLDQDGEMELIVQILNKDSLEPSDRVFDSQQDKVYCYTYPFRAILHVYEDGVMLGSSGASYNDWYTLTFKEEKAEETIVASQVDKKFYVKGKEVSGKKYAKFLKSNYSDDKELQWTEFQS